MLVTRNQVSSSSGNEKGALQRLLRIKGRRDAEKRHEEETGQAEELEARLREQLELLRSAKGHSDPPPPRIDGTPIPPQFRELVVDLFNGSQDPCVHLQTF
ncbi:hypothetical protein CR513_35162, partial [Mucuna pruriens]